MLKLRYTCRIEQKGMTFDHDFGYSFPLYIRVKCKIIHISVSFGVVKFYSSRGEGRRGWEGRVKNGVKMKHIITLEYIEFSSC